jgi:hypothetical protein
MYLPSLIYFQTGNYFSYELDENLGEMSDILSLQRYLIRHTRIELLEVTHDINHDHGWGGPEFSDYKLELEGLFWAPNEPDSGSVSNEFICALDELTLAGQRVYEIDFEKAKELYKGSYLKNHLSKKQLSWISEHDADLWDLRKDWNDEVIKQQIDLKIKENEKGLTTEEFMLQMGFALDDDDEHTLAEGAPNQLGLFPWIFGAVKGGHFSQLIKDVCSTDHLIKDKHYGTPNAKKRMVFPTHYELTPIGYPTLNTIENQLSLWLRKSNVKLDNDQALYTQALKEKGGAGSTYNLERKYNELRIQSLKKELLDGKLVEDQTLKSIQELLLKERSPVTNVD